MPTATTLIAAIIMKYEKFPIASLKKNTKVRQCQQLDDVHQQNTALTHFFISIFLFFLFLAAVIHSIYCLLLPIEHHSRWRLRVGGTFAMAIPKLLIQFRLPVDASITIKRGPWSEFILYLWHIEMKPSHSHLYPRIDSAEKITSANRQDNGKIACRRAGRVGAWVERVSYVSTISTISSQIVKPKWEDDWWIPRWVQYSCYNFCWHDEGDFLE